MKIGMIDYFLDEWHANHFPKWIADAAGGETKVVIAYAHIACPREGRRTTAQWCRDMNIREAASIEEVIAASDGIVVLSPDNSEMHEQLSELALKSGKPVFIDKTFAPDYASAKRMFDLADKFGTPCCTASSLRYASEYAGQTDLDKITEIASFGPNDFDTYSIHQLEPLMSLIQSEPVKVRYVPAGNRYTLYIDFADGKKSSVTGVLDEYIDYEMDIIRGEATQHVHVQSDFWEIFTQELLRFLKTGRLMVSHEETLRIMKVRTAGLKAAEAPNTVISIEDIRQ